MLHRVAPGIPLPQLRLAERTHQIQTLINHKYTHTKGEPFCSLFPAGFQAQIDWSVWEEDNSSGRLRAASRPQPSGDITLKDAIPGELLLWIPAAEPSTHQERWCSGASVLLVS